MKKLLWTESKARLKQIKTDNVNPYNWLFLPGGPGLGSESLYYLIELLNLPGSMWALDLPDDGSNITNDNNVNFSNWKNALIEASTELENVVLVTHSSGGMFALATPELESNIIGLVLMDSAPNASWQEYFAKFIAANPLPKVQSLRKIYDKNPNNETLKALTLECATYFSTKKSIEKIKALFNTLPYNFKSHKWAEENFDTTYSAKWVPQVIPTLIFAGDKDNLTPLHLFTELPEFKRENIHSQEIKNASHFPWLENPDDVKDAFEKFVQKLISYKKANFL